MSPSELLTYREADLFIQKVLRDVPVHYRFKIDIRDELCDHLLCAADAALAEGAAQKDAVSGAVAKMGKPGVLAKHYREALKGREGYKTQLFLMALRRWGGFWAYFILFCLFSNASNGGVGYTRCLFFAVPAAAVSYFCARGLAKWQNVLLNILAPLVFIVPIAALSLPLGGNRFAWLHYLSELSVVLPYTLCWIIPSAIVFAFVAAGERLVKSAGYAVKVCLVSACAAMLVFFAYRADFGMDLAQAGYRQSLDNLKQRIGEYLGGRPEDPEILLEAAAQVDYYIGKEASVKLVDRYAATYNIGSYYYIIESNEVLIEYTIRGALTLLGENYAYAEKNDQAIFHSTVIPDPPALSAEEAISALLDLYREIESLIAENSGELSDASKLLMDIHNTAHQYLPAE